VCFYLVVFLSTFLLSLGRLHGIWYIKNLKNKDINGYLLENELINDSFIVISIVIFFKSY